MLRGIIISRRANVQAECVRVCIFDPGGGRAENTAIVCAEGHGRAGSFPPLLEPDVCVGVKKQQK